MIGRMLLHPCICGFPSLPRCGHRRLQATDAGYRLLLDREMAKAFWYLGTPVHSLRPFVRVSNKHLRIRFCI